MFFKTKIGTGEKIEEKDVFINEGSGSSKALSTWTRVPEFSNEDEEKDP